MRVDVNYVSDIKNLEVIYSVDVDKKPLFEIIVPFLKTLQNHARRFLYIQCLYKGESNCLIIIGVDDNMIQKQIM